MRRNIAITVASAFAIGLGALACSDGATAPRDLPAEDGFEVTALETVGIAEDQANGSSVAPSSASADVVLSSAANHGVCTFSAATGRITCPDLVNEGLTISRSYALYDAADKPQEKRDSSTVKINTRIWARGTVEKESARVTIDRKSDLTATGVQASSPNKTLNGTEQGTSTMEHQTSRGKVKSTVTFGDTTINLVHPKPGSLLKWPLSGTVIRAHSGTRTVEGHAGSIAFSQRTVLVFDGTAIVKITITSNGQTRSCVRNLETREHSCTP